MPGDDYEMKGPYGIGITQVPLICNCEGGGPAGPCPIHASNLEYLRWLEEFFPIIHWREPAQINDLQGHVGLACRICIAKRGIRGDQIRYLPTSLEGHHKHLREYHQLPGY